MKEKDLDYIVKLERAIKKKYGDVAIQNPAGLWDKDKEADYMQQLQTRAEKHRKLEAMSEMENVDGILISRKLLIKERKINCSLCNNRTKTINDDIYMIKFDCCENCYIKNYERHSPSKKENENNGD